MAFGSSLGGIIGGGASGNVVGGAVVRLLLDAAKFEAQMHSAQGRLMAMGKGMSTLGGSITRGLTLPIVAAAGVSVKMAMDFEKAFTRIAAISNASAKDVKAWKAQVLDLAGETAQAPEKLAEALFFLSSAGLKANEIMPALEASAKAASVGLGDMTDVANITASVLNAYAGSGIKAANVTDILVQAVKSGRAEPEEFAGALGRILPIAAKAGVAFEDVAGSLAVLSNIGLDVNEGVTAMRGVIQAIVAPTKQAQDALEEMGITSDELRGILDQRGLVGTLRFLEKAADGNIDTMRNLVPNVRALTGAFGLTQQEATKVDAIFRQVAGSTGALDTAFSKTEQGAAFKFQQALAKLKTTAIEVGQQLLPVVTKIVEVIGDLAAKFGALSPATQETVIKVALLVAVLGPLLKILGSLITVIGAVAPAVVLVGKALVTLVNGPMVAITASIVSLILIIQNWKAAFEGVGKSIAQALPPAFYNALTNAIQGTTGAIGAQIKIFGQYVDSIDHASEALGDLAQRQKAVGSMGPIGGGGGGGRGGGGGNKGNAPPVALPTHHTGGPINRSGPAMLQAGEFVLSRQMVSALARSPSGGDIYITMPIHGDINDTERFAAKVEAALTRAASRFSGV